MAFKLFFFPGSDRQGNAETFPHYNQTALTLWVKTTVLTGGSYTTACSGLAIGLKVGRFLTLDHYSELNPPLGTRSPN